MLETVSFICRVLLHRCDRPGMRHPAYSCMWVRADVQNKALCRQHHAQRDQQPDPWKLRRLQVLNDFSVAKP